MPRKPASRTHASQPAGALKPATASSTSGANAPSRAFDEDIRTCWSAETGAAGEWLAVDLGANATAYAVQLNFAEANRQPLSDG